MKLYVANLTKQNFQFHYWLADTAFKRPIVQEIPPGRQVEVGAGHSLTSDDVNYIIEQHQHYGLVPSKEIDKAKKFIGTCYSIDKPVNIDSILYGIDINEDELRKAAHERRKESALAATAIVENVAKQVNSSLGYMNVEVVQDSADPFSEKVDIDQTIEVELDQKRTRGRPRKG